MVGFEVREFDPRFVNARVARGLDGLRRPGAGRHRLWRRLLGFEKSAAVQQCGDNKKCDSSHELPRILSADRVRSSAIKEGNLDFPRQIRRYRSWYSQSRERNWRCQMKVKTSAAALGLVGGLALGVWIGSEMTSGGAAVTPEPAVVATPVVEEPAATTVQRAKPKRVLRAARVSAPAAAVEAPAPESAPKLVMTIPVSAPELHARMKPVPARGPKLPVPAKGSTSAEQFATLAHAAKNTEVPFILLKHRVLTEGQSLEQAIRTSKPDLDAKSEVARARAAAKEDLAAVSAMGPSSTSTRSNASN